MSDPLAEAGRRVEAERVAERLPNSAEGAAGRDGVRPAEAGDVTVIAAAAQVGRNQLLDSLAVGLVPSLLGLVAYAILREAYVWFYQRYGVAPEEVGITHLRMLSSMLRFIHLWVLTLPGSPVTNFVLALLMGALAVAIWRRQLVWLRRRSHRVDLMASQHPVLLGFSVALVLLILTFAWALPRDRSFAGRRLQLGRAVRPEELAFLSIQADPARVMWIGRHAPKELVAAKLVYLGKSDGILVLYQPPDWSSCPVHDCRGATWKVRESDVVLQIKVNPPDRDAPKQASLPPLRDQQRPGDRPSPGSG
jgi:hypothetical protein